MSQRDEAASGAIEARFEWDAELLAEVDKMSRRRFGLRRYLTWPILLFGFVLVFLSINRFSVTELRPEGRDVLIAALGAVALIIALRAFLAPRRRRRVLRLSPQLQGETKIVIDGDGIRVDTPHVDSNYRWSAVTEVRFTPKAVGVFIGQFAVFGLPAAALDRSPEETAATIEAWRRAADFD